MPILKNKLNRDLDPRALQPSEPRKAAPRAYILVVDDDESSGRALEKLLRADGFSTAVATGGEAALAEAARVLPDAVLTDLQMPAMDGIDLCRRLHAIDVDLPVLLMTGFGDKEAVVRALRAGVQDYLFKPLEYDEVRWCIERAIEQRAAKLEQSRLREATEDLYRALNERLVLSSLREQEHAEAEAQQHAQLAALLENLNDGVIIVHRDGRVSMINEAARVMLGVGDDRLHTIDGIQSREAYDLERRLLPTADRPLARALRGEQFTDYEVLRQRADNQWRRLTSAGTSVRDGNGNGNGNVALAIVVFRDVTELRLLERHREEYLALVSHDLRNPLSSIVLGVAALRRSLARRGDTHDATTLERVERGANRMTAMIDELTEATMLEAGSVMLRRERCDMPELVRHVVGRLDADRARRITLTTESSTACVAFGDASQLERLIANLLTNALKYSADDAPVKVQLRRSGESVELEVTDLGIGIAPENVKSLFERYYRAPTGKARASGLGLGLYIARLVAEAHGGRIDVSSELGKGSAFTLVLPSLRETA